MSTVTPTFCSTSMVLVKSPSRSQPCDGRTDLIPGCSLHFLYPNFQQPMRPQPPKRRKLLASWGESSSSQGARLAPEAMMVSFLQTTSPWLTGSCSVAQSCPTLCDPMNCSTPGLRVLHHLPDAMQTHVH